LQISADSYTFVHQMAKKTANEYGGDLLKTRKARQGPRPVCARDTMHFVLRSTLAKGIWSFRVPKNFQKVEKILKTFSVRHGVRLFSYAVHFNHLHLHAQVSSIKGYKRFIRAVTAAIAMAITGMSRWNPLDIKFWDRRPFSRIARGPLEEATLHEYVLINKYEAEGFSRNEARRKMYRDRKTRAG